jgi:uncharacterized protein (DUF488 family)
MKQASDKQSVIYTIGHGNREIEALINLLNQNSITVLIDVRSLPYSRFHPQFRQSNLKHSLESVGITYLWFGKELGGRPADPSLYHNGKANYRAIKETEIFKVGIQRVLQLVKENIKVTLICSESNPNDCHRKHLIANELVAFGITVLHINKVGVIEQHVNINYTLFS